MTSSCFVTIWLVNLRKSSLSGCQKFGIILAMGSANERRRYTVTSSLIGWAHTQMIVLGLCARKSWKPIQLIRPYLIELPIRILRWQILHKWTNKSHMFSIKVPKRWNVAHVHVIESRLLGSCYCAYVVQWTSYQIRKTVGCACAGNAGDVFPGTDNGNR